MATANNPPASNRNPTLRAATPTSLILQAAFYILFNYISKQQQQRYPKDSVNTFN